MKTRVYKIELLVIDTEDAGPGDVRILLENTRYVHPKVVSLEEREIEWQDSHPLNQRDSWRQEYERLFQKDQNLSGEALFNSIFGK